MALYVRLTDGVQATVTWREKKGMSLNGLGRKAYIARVYSPVN